MIKAYLIKDPWRIIEDQFHAESSMVSESIFSIGNGYMGQRANFEEGYTGETLQGSYISGIYYPDKTRVGWWKNGYPEYFAKVLNSLNWIGIDITIGNQKVDLHSTKILGFSRILNMKTGILSRTMTIELDSGEQLQLTFERFCSYDTKELGVVHCTIKSIDYDGSISINAYLDFDVRNQDSNYDEMFWELLETDSSKAVFAKTKKTDFEVLARMNCEYVSTSSFNKSVQKRKAFYAEHITDTISPGEEKSILKKVIITTSFHHDNLIEQNEELLQAVNDHDFESLRISHENVWEKKWNEIDIKIEGDISAQQGVRYNIFQLHQTYSGEDARLNIGPKGFTGEKYGGSTYWDTEAYCLPFYLSTSDQKVARNLLQYRHNHLGKAIENAKKLGFSKGAALYPMVTMNGEECHNEWEITFEEIHRNGAIAYAIYDYTRYTGDESYLLESGIEVLIGIARFWAQRVNFSKRLNQYVILGVTGPNEYENNVNNNWYTNFIAKWCLDYTRHVIRVALENNPTEANQILVKNNFDSELELNRWKEISEKMYFPYDENESVFLQQDGFMDKEIYSASEIPKDVIPLHHHWSWDRILRSCFIKQADVLQGMYFFEDQFDIETIRKHFHFYEPLTVHESSLSPCVHSILACKIGDYDKAYEMYLRTARLDLDDYNNDTIDGLHITSMAGTWLSIVKGFGGMRVKNGTLSFEPQIPEQWKSLSFKIKFRSHNICIYFSQEQIILSKDSTDPVQVIVNNDVFTLSDHLEVAALLA